MTTKRKYKNPTLNARESSYGSFEDNADMIQAFKARAAQHVKWDLLSSAQKQAIDMMFTNIGRIITGDPNYQDSWHDIVGYAELIETIIIRNGEEVKKTNPS